MGGRAKACNPMTPCGRATMLGANRRAPMTAKAFFDFGLPPCGTTLGWHVLEMRPDEGWIKIGFEGRPEFCNPAGYVQGGFLSAMLDDTMGPAVVAMTEQKL